MIAAGVNAKALSTYMGHSRVVITLDRYGHLMPGNEGEAARLLDKYLNRDAAAWPTDAPTNGLSLAIFDSEDNARAVAERVPQMVTDAVKLESVEVREVVASA